MASHSSIPRARRLVDQIVQDARAHDNKALLAVDADPETEVLLDLLQEGESRQARGHLKAARIWRAQHSQKANEKLDAARTALDELDISLARGILRKVDFTLLDKPELDRYDELLLAVEARAVELEDIQSRLPSSPEQTAKPRRRFWKR